MILPLFKENTTKYDIVLNIIEYRRDRIGKGLTFCEQKLNFTS